MKTQSVTILLLLYSAICLLSGQTASASVTVTPTPSHITIQPGNPTTADYVQMAIDGI